MADSLLQVADGFWNIRGSFKIAGFVDIGTQSSLVRREDGSFVLLDAYTLQGDVKQQVFDRTDGGAKITAVLHLHPFHTIHCRAVHELLPHARQYGTARHQARKPELPWEDLRTEDPGIAELFPEFSFSVPAGVDFIPDDENLHFSSVLAFHSATRTLHVDDTLMFTKIPFVGGVRFHPTLAKTLERRAGAVKDFRAWADDLVKRCEQVDNLCAAHTRPLLKADNTGPSIAERVQSALDAVDSTLAAHEKKHG